MDGGETNEIEAMVDTGSACTMPPGRLLREQELVPIAMRQGLLADRRWMVMDYGENDD